MSTILVRQRLGGCHGEGHGWELPIRRELEGVEEEYR